MTRHKGGKELMGLIGFQERKNEQGEAVWSNLGSVSYLKGVRLELQQGHRLSVD